MDEVLSLGGQGDLFRPQGPRSPWRPRDNEAGRRTSTKKLLGQVFTPSRVAEQMLAWVEWPDERRPGILFDAACGDGVFLEAAVQKVLRSGRPRDDIAAILEERLVGWDVDPAQVVACRQRLERVAEAAGLEGIRFRVECRDALAAGVPPGVSCVVGNPPYLEAKRMPDDLKRAIHAAFPEAADGGFDLFGAFVAFALRLTRRGGEVCLILPNRFLTGTYAAALRRVLREEYEAEVFDLSRERVFRDAAVYPIILHARKTDSGTQAGMEGRGHASRTGQPSLSFPSPALDIWPLTPADPHGRALFERVMTSCTMPRLAQVAEVRWTVSFHRAGLRDAFVTPEQPAATPHAQRFLGGGRFHGNREVLPFRVRWDGWWIDYDETRARRMNNAFPPLSLFTRHKVVVCQNARRLRAAVDREGFVLKDTFLAVLPRRSGTLSASRPVAGPDGHRPSSVGDLAPVDATLDWLCLVLQSDVIHYLYEHLFAGTRKGGGYLQFLPRFLAILPVPPCPDEDAAVRLAARLAEGEPAWKEAESMVLDAFEVSRSERRALMAYGFPERENE